MELKKTKLIKLIQVKGESVNKSNNFDSASYLMIPKSYAFDLAGSETYLKSQPI